MKREREEREREREMSAKSLAKRLVEISSRGGSKANTKELMKRWTGFLNEKVRRSLAKKRRRPTDAKSHKNSMIMRV